MSEEIKHLIEKMITKLDSLIPYIDDSEEILLATKTLQELVNVNSSGSGGDMSQIENEIAKLDRKITDLTIELKAKDSKLETDVQTINVDVNNIAKDVLKNSNAISSLSTKLNEHREEYRNPHEVTKTQLELNNVVNYPATDNVNDDSEKKYALAKGVNMVWKKANEVETTLEDLVSKVADIEEILGSSDMADATLVKGPLRVMGTIKASDDVIAFCELDED